MEVTTLRAQPRKELGRNQVARLREQGRVPCVLYGEGGDSVSLHVDEASVERELRHHHRVFRLEHGGQTEGVFLQDVQFDVITDRTLHLDFRRIDLDKPIAVEVELKYIGHAAGLSKGGSLVKDSTTLTVNSLPAAVPEDLPVPVKDLDLGGRILAKELELPAGVTLIEGSEDTSICHMAGGSAAEDEEAPAEG